MTDKKDVSCTVISDGHYKRVERFQSLMAGQYWKAQRDIPENGIPEGQVLLIESIKWVDNKAHTIILRAHPSMYDQYIVVPSENSRRQVRFTSMPFLLDDFMSLFEYEPDHARVRAQELEEVQRKIQSLQEELVEAQHNPQILRKHISDTLQSEAAQEDGEQAKSLMSPADIQGLSKISLSDVISQGVSAQSIAMFQGAAEQQHAIATIKAKWMEGKTGEIAETIQKMTPFYQEQAACALAQTEDVRSHVSKLLDGIKSLNLYVGEDVEVLSIRKGRSADTDIPLTVAQRKLMMDEELALWTDVDEAFDHRQRGLFFEMLASEEGLANQVFPTERCILVMASTRREIRYSGDAAVNFRRNQANAEVFLLARDGENISMIISPIEGHLGASKLFPSKDDQDSIFRGFDGRDITFRDIAYTSSLDRHDAHALHYKRFLILLCGLDHRLNLFGNFYPGEKDFNFVTKHFQERYMRFLHDDDGEGLLGEADQLSLYEWERGNQSRIEPGSRVLVQWDKVLTQNTSPGAFSWRYNEYQQNRHPVEPYSEVVVVRRKDKMTVLCDVTIHSSGKPSRVAVDLALDKVPEGILCLEGVTIDELNRYMMSRNAREGHISYIRLFRQAIKILEQDRIAEQGARDLLHSKIHGKAVVEVDSAISRVISAWRVQNKGKPFPLPEDLRGTTLNRIEKQLSALLDPDFESIDLIESLALNNDLIPLRLVMNSLGEMVLYAEMPHNHRDNRIEAFPWVYKIVIKEGKALSLPDPKGFSLVLLARREATEHVLFEWPEVEAWQCRKSVFNSPDHKEKLLDLGSDFAEKAAQVKDRKGDFDYKNLLRNWDKAREELSADTRVVSEPRLVLPVGILVDNEGRHHELCIGRDPVSFLYDAAPDQESRKMLAAEYVSPYKMKKEALNRFWARRFDYEPWKLCTNPVDRKGLFCPASNFFRIDAFRFPLISQQLKEVMEQGDYRHLYVHPSLMVDGELVVDRLMEIKIPQNYNPVKLIHTRSDEMDYFDIWPIDGKESFIEGLSNQSQAMAGKYIDFQSAMNALENRTKGRTSSPIPEGMNPPDGVKRFIFLKD